MNDHLKYNLAGLGFGLVPDISLDQIVSFLFLDQTWAKTTDELMSDKAEG